MKTFGKILVLYLALFISSCGGNDDEAGEPLSRIGLVMSPDQEVQDSTVVSSGSGVLDVSYNKTSREFRYRITWSSLSSDTIIGAHINGAAPKGANGPAVFDFTASIPQIRSGVFSGGINVDSVGMKEDSLLAGLYYVNLRTPKYPEGEIRGQIEF